jgi:FkbM family methyltransferase
MNQFLNTLEQIVHSDSVGPLEGILRHSQWQLRKLFHKFPCQLPIARSRLYVDRPSGVAALVNAMGEYDYNNMELLRFVLSLGANTFIDIGANIGVYTLIASEVPDSCVISIEPHPSTFALLKLNVELNARKNVLCLNLALSSKESEVPFSDLSIPELNRVLKPGEQQGGALLVRSRRFEDVCIELGLHPDILKIDVEGHEEEVLRGFGDFAGTAKMIFIENGDLPELRALLQTAGYNGPWFFHFKQKLLSKKKQARPEDPVYLAQDFLSDLRSMNFVIG